MGEMKMARFYAEPDPLRAEVRLYHEVEEAAEPGKRAFLSLIDGFTFHQVEPGQEPPMYIRPIPLHLAEEVARALAPRPEVTERHLDDAIEVRDRLLSLVEHVVHPMEA
jgi:hypothetical protein